MLYREHGLLMMPEHAQYQAGQYKSRPNEVETGIMDILDRMKTGRFKVARHLEDWWDEFRAYHRDDGKIVKRKDDLMDATRYAVMSLRFARAREGVVKNPYPRRVGMDYDPFEALN